MLENIDKDSPEFKLMIKQMNFDTKTKYEQHLENQKEYQEYMQALSYMTEEEG